MKNAKRILSLALTVLMLLSLCIFTSADEKQEEEITILFTHDLHSHLLPDVQSKANPGGAMKRVLQVKFQSSIN